MVRRGRNNRIMAKFIENHIFEDSENSDEENDKVEKKKILKKRKKKYQSVLDYL